MAVIDGEACYAIWAPASSVWTAWAKPVLFARGPLPANFAPVVGTLEAAGLPGSFAQAAIVVDLPGAEAVTIGLALAERGFRPVPLFNGTSGPTPVLDVEPLRDALGAGAAVLPAMPLTPEAAPAFLLDSRRYDPRFSPREGAYDNRWIVLPQDFPSAIFLLSHGVREVTIVQREGLTPADDLVHVLRRWQEGGVKLRLLDLSTGRVVDPLEVPAPSRFRRAWYAAVALLGFRRSDVGGFGSTIPEQTSGRGGGFYG
jgi:hypothetical protein